jgi:hypothetical protein
MPWHKSLTYNEYDAMQADLENFRSRVERENKAAEQGAEARRVEEVKASEEKIRMTTKRCPGCERHIEKNGGW